MKFLFKYTCAMIATAIATSALSASAAFFTDGLDDTAAWTVAADADTTVGIVDYSTLGIPEAPNMVAGSAVTTGVKMTSNTLGSAQAANLLGASIGGNADLALSTYQVQFDAWMNTADPLPAGSTEQIVFGLGRTTSTPLGRYNRGTAGDGSWGWLAVENGYGTEDSALFSGTAEQADIGDTNTDDINNVYADLLFNAAFDTTVSDSANDAPANQWVTVTMTVDSGNVTVYYNDYEFLSATGMPTNGDIMLGYEDPFGGSVGAAPLLQFSIIDNVIIDDQITIVPKTVPEPTTLALAGLCSLALLYRRR